MHVKMNMHNNVTHVQCMLVYIWEHAFMHVFQTLHVIQVTFKACACITVRLTVAQSSSAGGSNDVGKMFLHWLHYVNLRYNNKVCQGFGLRH